MVASPQRFPINCSAVVPDGNLGMRGSPSEELLSYCHRLPKCELHAHLNGSIRNSTIRELAQGKAVEEPLVAAEAHLLTSRGEKSLEECFRLFALIHSLTTTHAVIKRIAREVIEDFAADNVVYLELRTTPKANADVGMSKRSYVEAVLAGLGAHCVCLPPSTADGGIGNGPVGSGAPMEGTADEENGRLPIAVRLLLSIDRREDTAAAMETVSLQQVQLAWELRHRGVAGIDLSGNPAIGTWQTWLPALQWARNKGLPLTLHCGEVPNQEEVSAMLALKPERLGHVCCLDKVRWEELLKSDIPVEVCLTSNVRTLSVASYSTHHFAELKGARHPLVICTDDCGVFFTTLSQEYALAATAFGLSSAELRDLALAPIEYSFIDSNTKLLLREAFLRKMSTIL